MSDTAKPTRTAPNPVNPGAPPAQGAPARLRWSTRPPLPPRTGTRTTTAAATDGREVLLRWTEDLDDERAITLWAGIAAVDAPADREAALLRWVDWAGVTVPLGLKLRDLVDAVATLITELEATARSPERVHGGDPSDLLPMMRALQGWMRAREAVPGAVLGAARALVLAEETVRATAPLLTADDEADERESFEVIPAGAGRERVSSRDLCPPRMERPDRTDRGERTVLGQCLHRRIERASSDETAELLDLYLRAERPTELPPWAESALDFLLLEGELRAMPTRMLASLAVRWPHLWTRYVRTVTHPRDALRAVRLLAALAAHEDIARTLGPAAATLAGEVLARLLGHPRFSVWSRAARTLGGIAGALPNVAARLLSLLEPTTAALLRRRAYAAVANLSPLAGEALARRRRALFAMAPAAEGGAADGSALAALAVGLPDLAAEGGAGWVDLVRSIAGQGGPEAWSALARSLQEIAQRRPEARALVEVLAQDVRARAEAWRGTGPDAELVERALALATRLASPEEAATLATLLLDWTRSVARDPGATALRAQAEALAAELDLVVAGAARAAAQETPRTASRGAAALEELLDLLVDGDLGVVARRVADPPGRTAALGASEALRARLLRLAWTGLRRPTPAGFAWRRWLLRAAAALPAAAERGHGAAGETATREQSLETLERVADDPQLAQPSLQRYVAGAVSELAEALRPEHGARASVAVLAWMAVRGATLARQGKLRRWLGDEAPRAEMDQLFGLVEAVASGRDPAPDLHALASLAGGDRGGLGSALTALATECEALARRRPEPHWSGLPRFDLATLAAVADTLQRARSHCVFALTRAAVPAVGAPAGGTLVDRAGGLDRMLTSTSLKFVDATRRAEIVEHYVSELSALSEAIASACGPVVGVSVRGLLAKALVAVRGAARDAVKDREGAVRYIARLRVLGELSSAHEGGMAATYLAEGPAPGKRVVVKLLPWERIRGASADMARAMFEGEMERLAGIVHPNVVSLVDAGFVEEGAYLALEYIPGASLETLLRAVGPMTLRRLGPVVRDVARALGHLHPRGIIHRDIKPGNILVQPDIPDGSPGEPSTWAHADIVRAVVIDFGISTAGATQAGAEEGVTGTPGYIAPEVARGMDLITPAIDVYALAVVAFEMLTGSNPYLEGRPDIHTILVRHASMPLPWQALPPAVARPELVTLLTEASRFDPRQRPSARDFLARWTRLME